jgi:hypothetical protein
LFGFDGAKVRRFFHPAMTFGALCSQTAPFVDESQKRWGDNEFFEKTRNFLHFPLRFEGYFVPLQLKKASI